MLDSKIETFLSVCRYMNFTKASQALNITQPAVSQHIRHLEEEYGVKLFEYRSRKLYLTPAGRQLYQAALTMQHDEKILAQRMKTAGQAGRTLSFGITMSVSLSSFPSRLAACLKAQPGLGLRLQVANTQELLKQIDSGRIDFAVVEGYFPRTEYEYRPYSLEPFSGVCRPDYAFLCGHEPASLQDILQEPLLTREEGSGTREILERYLAGSNLSVTDFPHILEVNSMPVICRLALEGCGIAFLYQVCVRRELAEGSLRLLTLPGLDTCHEFSFIWRKNSIYREEFEGLFARLCC